MSKEHKHLASDFCVCNFQGCEPDDECPVHGCPNPREVYRCIICGQFMEQPDHETLAEEEKRKHYNDITRDA